MPHRTRHLLDRQIMNNILHKAVTQLVEVVYKWKVMISNILSQLLSLPLRLAVLTICLLLPLGCLKFYHQLIHRRGTSTQCFCNDFVSTLCLLFQGWWLRGNASTVTGMLEIHSETVWNWDRKGMRRQLQCYTLLVTMYWPDISSALRNPIANSWGYK